MKIYFLFMLLLMNAKPEGGQTPGKYNDRFMPIGYDLSVPERIHVLPAVLHEISGIVEIDASSVACVQDEHGFVFIYDLIKNQITRQLYFSSGGDYEGITRVDKSLYILRSDGVLFEVPDYESAKTKSIAYSTGIPEKDNEGLCYDKKNNRLLIAPKVPPVLDRDGSERRFIYSFDLTSKKLIKDPVFKLDVAEIKRFAIENKIKVPMKKRKKGQKEEPDIKLRISATGIHPITNKLFVLSGIEQLLFVFDMNGNIEHLERLDREIFRQPEGITFMRNGDMYISDEGQNRSSTLVLYKYKPRTGF